MLIICSNKNQVISHKDLGNKQKKMKKIYKLLKFNMAQYKRSI